MVAVEFCAWATPLPTFKHPERAFYIFGPEQGSLERETNLLSACEHTVFIPTRHCMNLAAAVQVVLYDRMAKDAARLGIPLTSLPQSTEAAT